MEPPKSRNCGSLEPALVDQRREILGAREAADARRQVRVGLPARQHAAEQRHDAVEPEREERLQDPARLRDLEDREPAAGPQDAPQLAEAGTEIGDVAHAEADRGGVEARVRVGQREHVALDPLDRVRLAPRPHEHLAREVEPRDDAALALGGDREVARAAARVEHAGAGLDDRLDREPAPAAVEPHRHDVVHDVVDRRDPVEHRPHAFGLQRPTAVFPVSVEPTTMGHGCPQRGVSAWSMPT